MIIEAPQWKPKEIINYNQWLLENLKGDLDDKEAKITLVEFLKYNLGVCIDLLSGGDLTLYPYQEIILKSWWKRNYCMNVISRGGSKCEFYSKDNFVIEKKRGLISITELFPNVRFEEEKWVKPNEDIELWNGNKWVKLNKYLIQPPVESIQIQTRCGYKITGSVNHRVKVIDKNSGKCEIVWKKFSELNENDYVAISRNDSLDWGQDSISKDDLEEAYLIGLLIANGSYSEKAGHLSSVSVDRSIIDFCKKFTDLKTQGKKGTKAVDVRFRKEFADRLFNKYDIEKGTSYFNSIPQKILRSKKLLKECLIGLFDANGVVKIDGQISFCSTSIDLINQIHNSLLVFGIISRVATRKTSSPFGKAYIIDIKGQNARKFHNKIGFKLKRKNARKKVLFDKKENLNIDVIPNLIECFDHIKFVEKDKLRGVGSRKCAEKMTGYNWLNKYIQAFDNSNIQNEKIEKLKEIQQERFFFDKIVKIENKNKLPCLDFNIPEGEMYWSNGMINHNSTLASIFCILYGIFNPDSKIIVTSSNFRTSRRILQQIYDIVHSKNANLLKQCFPKDLERRTDGWNWNINGGYIQALPLTEGTRGVRADVLICDEFLLLPKSIVEKVLFPFLAVSTDQNFKIKIRKKETELIKKGLMKEEDRMQFMSNKKMICLSSASYQFEYLYELYKKWKDKIYGNVLEEDIKEDDEAKNATYVINQLSYEALPKDLMDSAVIEEAKEGGSSQSVFLREWGAQFTDDSDSYFSAKKMLECTVKIGDDPTIELIGDKNAKYILAIDPNRSSSLSADHFAMSLVKIYEENQSGVLVHNFAKAGVSAGDLIEYFKYIVTHFNVVYIIVDHHGGPDFVASCNNSTIMSDVQQKYEPFISDFNEKDYENSLKEARRTYDLESGKILHIQFFSSNWLRRANEYLNANFDNKKIWFASKVSNNDSEFNRLKDTKLPFWDSEEKRKKEIIEFILDQDENMDMVRKQCALIQVSTTSLGNLSFDLPQHLKKSTAPNRARKDSYTTLLLANWGLKCYFDMLNTPIEDSSTSFVPFSIG